MFLFERRDDASFFFFSLSGKTQVNIYLLSLLILNSLYVTRSRQSEGRSLNTSRTHYKLSNIKEKGLYNIIDREIMYLDFYLFTINLIFKFNRYLFWERKKNN
jgi:hypothetical protein